MRIGLPLIAVASTLLLFSCEKEKSFDPTGVNTGGNSGTGLLERTVTKFGSDSAVTGYGYNANKNLVSLEVTGDDLLFSNTNTEVTRNSNNIIEKIEVDDPFAGTANGKITYTVHYDVSSKRYTSKVSSLTSSGFISADSVVYKYDASGRIIEEKYYVSNGFTVAYQELEKFSYRYDSRCNMVESTDSFFDDNSATYEPIFDILLEYDSKINPLNLGAEAIILGQALNLSGNNVAKLSFIDLQDPNENESFAFQYSYNASGKPTKADRTIENLGVSVPMFFYYK